MNMNVRIVTLDVVDAGLCVDEHVNVLRPSGLHQHCLGMALVKVTVGVPVHYRRWPSDRALHLPQSGEEMYGAFVSRKVALAHVVVVAPLLYGVGQYGATTMSWLRLPIMARLLAS
jgi:hypothetical protein